MKKIAIFLLFISQICLAQEKLNDGDLRLRVSKAITQHIDRDLLGKTPTGFVYLFSVTLSFNEEGKIDTVFFPRKINENINKVMKLNSTLVKIIIEQKSVYRIYASKLVFIPMLYHSIDDDKLDYRSGFLESFENLLPDIVNSSSRSWLILNPLVEIFGPPRK